MRILVVMDPIVPFRMNNTVGSTKITFQTCCGLVGYNDIDEIVVASRFDEGDPVPLINGFSFLNIYSGRRIYMKDAFKILNDHLESNHYDSIWINISTPSVANYLKDLNNKDTPVYFTMHSWTGTAAISYYYKNEFIDLVDNNKVKFIFLCRSQMETLFSNIEREPKNYEIVYNAVDHSNEEEIIINDLPESFMREGYNLMVARLVKSKHPYDVIKACLVSDQNLLIVGQPWINDKEYSDDVRSLINDNPERIYHIDSLPNSQILYLMRNAKSTILFTDIEVSNLTVLESCMVGTPVVIGPRGSGVSETIDNLRKYGGYVQEIILPKNVKWDKKYLALGELIKEAGNHRYDTNLFPECYNWNTHVDYMHSILTNKVI